MALADATPSGRNLGRKSPSGVRIDNFSLVALIGNKMEVTTGIAGDLFGMLRDYNIRFVCHGASANNICFLVKEGTGEEVVKKVHKKFIG